MSEQERLSNEQFALTSNSPQDNRLKKKWGYISALPSEYLLHFRAGKLLEQNSGQAATCFKFWRDTVFIIPTSLKEIIFSANQLTEDNVDVRIRGMAVYRIKNPQKIYKLINFSNRQQAEAKLAKMISDMCRSNAKWLVANMGVEECIRKRKEEIADALRNEVARVVADEESGWGVEIVTIDIQDVFIQDEEIFSAMQTTFKMEKIREAELAQLKMKNELETKTLQAELELGQHRKNAKMEQARIDAEIKEEELKLSRGNDEKQFELDRYRTQQQESIDAYKSEQEFERERQRAQLQLELANKEAEADKVRNQAEIGALQARIEVENQTNAISLERHFIDEALPTIARAIAESLQNVQMNVYQSNQEGGHTPFQFALQEVMQTLKARTSHLHDE